MALLCPAGVVAQRQQHMRQEGCRADTSSETMEREDSRLPLLGVTSPRNVPDVLGAEHEKAMAEAVGLLKNQLSLLQRGKRVFNRTETSELLRDTCQALGDLTTGLENRWRKTHPNEPLPPWPINSIPEEELARIGWDFYANRVLMVRNTGGSIWESIAFLFAGDEQASFAKPPSAGAVADAFSRVSARLGTELASADDDSSALQPPSCSGGGDSNTSCVGGR